ncbi:hypothetical protein FGF04_38640, partial [Streptomyces apricus]
RARDGGPPAGGRDTGGRGSGGWDAAGREVGHRDAGGRGSRGREATGREAGHREPGSREATGRETGYRDAAGQEARHRESGGREAAGREAGYRDAAGREARHQESGSRESGGREAAGRETGYRDAAGREAGDRERGNRGPGDREAGDRQGVQGPGPRAVPPSAETHHGYGTAGWGAAEGGAQGHRSAGPHVMPAQGGAPRAEHTGSTGSGEEDPDDVREPGEGGRKGTPLRGTPVPRGARKRGLSAWARRLAGARGEGQDGEDGAYDPYETAFAEPVALGVPEPDRWPDPAALLLAALGPGPRLWERGPKHPEALVVRLGTADRSTSDGSGLLPAVPVTVGLREVGALGLAGPRERLSGLARAVVAQLAALHSPDALEITLLSTDRSRSLEERTAEWSWLGWLPHLRPTHGQDCRLLLAYDREQAAARAEELVRRLEDHLTETGRTVERGREDEGPRPGGSSPDDSGAFAPRPRNPADTGPGATSPARGSHPFGRDEGATHLGLPRSGIQTGEARDRAHRPSWARPDDPERPRWTGPRTVVVVDGDPGSAAVRDAVARLAVEGPQVGIHVVCLAETPAASPSSPVADTYEAACAVSPVFRACGAVALLSGDVATALRLLRVAPGAQGHGMSGGPVGHGTVAAVDAVSTAWAERFARALAPLRTDAAGERHTRVSAPLPQSARLLDELGLARATPASLMARWADAADDPEALGGRVTAVLGAGPRGPVAVDLPHEGPHLLVEGPPGSGRTELLRAVAASLAAAERPDRLGIVLVDGRDGTGGGGSGGSAARGDGLQVCTDLPHVTTHLGAHDPVRMREFAQSLSAELKRRAELLGRLDFTEWHARPQGAGRIVAQRQGGGAGLGSASGSVSGAAPGGQAGAADLDTPPSSTLRLRPAATRARAEAAQAEAARAVPALPRLVVVVDDLDALLSPPLGSPGRPAAGSVVRALEAVARDGARLGVHLYDGTGGGPAGRPQRGREQRVQ